MVVVVSPKYNKGPDQQVSLPRVICICNALLDITVHTDEEFLQNYDLEPNNAILLNSKTERLEYDIKNQFNNIQYSVGGSGQNTIRGIQSFLPDYYTAFFGCLGDDENGSILETELINSKVITNFERIKDIPTGTCINLLTSEGRNRSLVANLGASKYFDVKFLELIKTEKFLKACKVYYATGFISTVSLPSVQLLYNIAKQENKVFAFNLSATFVIQELGKRLTEILQNSTFVFGNKEEFERVATVYEITFENDQDLLSNITNLFSNSKQQYFIMTNGSEPVLVCDGISVTSYPVPCIDSNEKIVDTTGAGDAFVAGFIVGHILDKSIGQSIELAIDLASHMITVSGVFYSNYNKRLLLFQS